MKCPVPRLRRGLTIAVILASTGLTACAAAPIPPPIHSRATLGSIIIYKNGVAYFERYLPPGEKELTLVVPVERVDDFLKSLTIVDKQTGETMPVSYPTLDQSGADVEMTIALPEGHHGLTISYVTESPSWKPSYRLVLSDDGNAKLQGWAVVDNVSGEDWKDVRVGVGSTSALSFRYDLHSVRLVERETLSSGSLVAVAPPTGGASYATTTDKPQIVADFRQSELSDLTKVAEKEAEPEEEEEIARGPRVPATKRPAIRQGGGRFGAGGLGVGSLGHGAANQPSPEPASGFGKSTGDAKKPRPKRDYRRSRAELAVVSLAGRLRSSGERIRIEGYANSADDDPRTASLDRANVLRNTLIDNGVSPDQVEAIGNGTINDDQGLRVTTVVAENEKQKDEPKTTAEMQETEGAPLGRAHFLSSEAMTIERDHSAMVSILNADTTAKRVYFYDPISERGSKDFAFNAVRLENPSEYTLDSGPFTVYVNGQFLGEGLTEPILPKAAAFVPYALDRNLLVEPEITGREEIARLITIQRGIVSTESRSIRRTKLAITNRGQKDAEVYVRHRLAAGHELMTLGPEVSPPEKLDGALLFKVQAPAGKTVDLVLEEQTPVERTVDITQSEGVEAIALYLEGAKLDPDLKKQLQAIVKRHQNRADQEQRIETLSEQMEVYRRRVDELNVQLVTLRKLPQGAKLRRHLSDKMEEISDKLQEATLRLADMRADLMTQRIELSDALAELTLEKPKRDQELASKD
ncbi:MAG: hypothetical protein R3B72_13505 [Polyangiaceae bacterium]